MPRTLGGRPQRAAETTAGVPQDAPASPGLARARFEAIANELAPHRIVATPKPVAVGPNHAIIQSVRYLVTLPACPNWTGPGPHDFTNAAHSNFGCADQVNLGRMVASPADLVEGRPVAATEGTPAAAAVNRYLTDKVQLPTAATVGPIAAQPSAAPAAAGGTTGSTP